MYTRPIYVSLKTALFIELCSYLSGNLYLMRHPEHERRPKRLRQTIVQDRLESTFASKAYRLLLQKPYRSVLLLTSDGKPTDEFRDSLIAVMALSKGRLSNKAIDQLCRELVRRTKKEALHFAWADIEWDGVQGLVLTPKDPPKSPIEKEFWASRSPTRNRIIRGNKDR